MQFIALIFSSKPENATIEQKMKDGYIKFIKVATKYLKEGSFSESQTVRQVVPQSELSQQRCGHLWVKPEVFCPTI